MKPSVLAAVVVVVALVIGGGAFAALRVFGGGGGYRSPDAVASALDKAIADKNLLTLADLVAPSERSMADSWGSALQDDSTDSEFDFQKLIGADALEEYVSAISVNSSRIEYKIDEEHDDLAVIDVTSWTLDGALAPGLVSDMKQNYEEAKGSALTTREQQAFDEMDLSRASFDGDVVDNLDGISLRLVVVRENDRWYLSVLMSAGEMLYREVAATADLTDDMHMPVPDYGANFDESGGQSSAEGAVETVVKRIDVERTLQAGGWTNPVGALSLIDRAGIAGLLSFPERRAALVYGPAFNLCAANPEMQGCGDDELTQKQLSITWALDSEEVNGKRVVGAGTTSYVYSESESSDDTTSVSFSGTNVLVKRGSSDEVTKVDLARGIDNPERIGVVSVEEDGKWVVSLGDTFANLLALKADSSSAQQVGQDGSGDDSSDHGVWTLLRDTPPYAAWTLIGNNATEAARQE